jgi:hypothetical protein
MDPAARMPCVLLYEGIRRQKEKMGKPYLFACRLAVFSSCFAMGFAVREGW